MTDKKRTSISIDEENKEWLDSVDANLSEMVNEMVSRKRMASSKTRPEELRERIAEKQNELEEAKEEVRRIKSTIEELETELERYESGERDAFDDLIDAIEDSIRLGPDERTTQRLQPLAERAGITVEQFAHILDEADIHSVEPAATPDADNLGNLTILEEENVLPDELVDENTPKLVDPDDADEYVTLTDKQEAVIRNIVEEDF